MKRRITILTMALLAAMLLCNKVLAASSGKCGDSITWTLDDDGNLTLTGSGQMYWPTSLSPFSNNTEIKRVTIGDSITNIGWMAFSGCTSLASVTIPESVTLIDYESFSGCTSLAKVTLPERLTEIRERAFKECSSLTEINIPYGVKTIGESAFSGCTNLTSVTIPESVISIAGVFSGCTSLTSITIPENVTNIAGAFSGCTSLTSVTLPKKLAEIGVGAFSGCTSLASIDIPESVISIAGAFSGCTSLASVTIPKGATNIAGAFSGCTSLTSIDIPKSVTNIARAFSGCTSLASVNLPENLTEIGEGAFSECTGLRSITIPDSVRVIGNSAFGGCKNLNDLTLPKRLTTIGDYAFSDALYGLDTISIPENVTAIGDGAFNGGNGFAEVVMNSAIPPKIKSNTFLLRISSYIKTPLASVSAYKQADVWKDLSMSLPFYGGKVVKDGITYYIDDRGAFAHAADSSLTEITFEENVEFEGSKYPLYKIEDVVLGTLYYDRTEGCDATLITLPSTVKEISGMAFSRVKYPIIIVRATTPPTLGCGIPMTTAIVPPESVKAYRESDVWKDMTIIGEGKNDIEVTTSKTVDLTEAIMTQARLTPASVTSIKVHGPLTENDIVNTLNTNMRSCYSIDLSDAEIDTLPDNAFKGKTVLIDIALPACLKSIGGNAFKDCVALLSTIKLPEGVERIGDYAFSNCTSAKFSPELPTTLKEIGNGAFESCRIYEIALPKGLSSIGNEAFEKCRLSEVVLPEGLSSMGSMAFNECKLLKKVDMTNLFNLTAIPPKTFYCCTSLSEVILPFNLESIDERAFAGCSALSKLDFVATLKTIGWSAFSGCTSLNSLDLFKCEELNAIYDGAFANCKSLKSLNLPIALQTIGDGAFSGCSAVNLISCPVPTPPTISSESTLNGIDKDVCVLAMPKDSYLAYFRAPYWGQFIEYTASVLVGVEGQGSVMYGNNGGKKSEPSKLLRTPEAGSDAAMATAYNGINICAKDNTTLTFKITPNEGEEIMSVTYAGKDVTSQVVDGLFTTPVISRDTDLKVSFTSDQGGVSQIDADGIRVYAEGRTIHIITDQKARVRISTVTGVQRSTDVEAGETTLEMATPGIYIVNGQKVIVR